MTHDTSISAGISEDMISFKDALGRAHDGPRKNAALRHFLFAQIAHNVGDEFEANEKLEAARRSLALGT